MNGLSSEAVNRLVLAHLKDRTELARRTLFLLCFLPTLGTSEDTWDPLAFGHAYNAWVDRLKNIHEGFVDAKAAELWERVKDEWPELKKHIDRIYKPQ